MNERDVQRKCVEYARSRGWSAWKFSSPANNSVPDYLFAKVDQRGKRHVILDEFKATDKYPTEIQADTHDEMRAAGLIVWSHNDVERFVFDLNKYEVART